MIHILVTNDDGVTAPGLAALATAMLPLGRVTVFAPDRNWSACGHVKTLNRPLRVNAVPFVENITAFACDGAPSDCVALAHLGVVAPFDLVVSGINSTFNLGQDVTYSGTVTAAMEGAVWGVPAIAFSTHPAEHGYSPSAAVAQQVVQRLLAQGEPLPHHTLLNVNIPSVALADIQGIALTRQGLRIYRDALDSRIDPRGQPYYWIGGSEPSGVPEPGNDIAAIQQNWVSITPLDLDLTAHNLLPVLSKWQWTNQTQPEGSHHE
jgi:5'-nucleotidase